VVWASTQAPPAGPTVFGEFEAKNRACSSNGLEEGGLQEMPEHDRARKAILVFTLPCTSITTYHLLRNGTQDAKSFTAVMVIIELGAFYV